MYRSRPRTNGATQTFRRLSLATNQSHSSQHQRESSLNQVSTTSTNSGVYLPPHLNSSYQPNASRSTNVADNRYSREQLIDVFKSQSEAGELSKNLSNLLVGDWDPRHPSSSNGGSWSRRDEASRDVAPGPDVCWVHDGTIQPLALSDMSEEEKEVQFAHYLT